jgi:hypothetical protein
MPLFGAAAALTPPDTSDMIALGAVVLAVVGAVIAYQQLRAGHAQLEDGKDIARAQFLLNMDQAFEADNDTRIRLANGDQSQLTRDEWRQVKRYMARFERVAVFVSEGLLDAAVVHRLYGARFRNVVKNSEIRARLLEGSKAANWADFIELWRTLDALEMKASGSHLCPGVAPPKAPSPQREGQVVTAEKFEDEDGTR